MKKCFREFIGSQSYFFLMNTFQICILLVYQLFVFK